MKNFFSALTLAVLSVGLSAQSAEHKFGFTAGGGSQKYSGDLGNGFTTKTVCWYGQVGMSAGYYLNRSFDISLIGTIGDFGFHQSAEDKQTDVKIDDRCPGCIGRVELDNLSSRMTTGGIQVKYKFANGYLLNEDFCLKPYVFAGASFIHLVDRMKMNCVDAGNYTSLTGGAGVRYDLTERLNVGYNLTFGYFTTDGIDYKTSCRNDMYMQNSLFLGIDLF